MIIRLGVVDIPYADKETPNKQRARIKKNRHAPKQAAAAGTKSTGDVAEILEEKYHIMEIFAELNKPLIGELIGKSLAGAMEAVLQGGGNGPPPFAEAESAIKARFDEFITLKEMDALGYPGIPTQASLDGVSHRFTHPYAKRASRPSFVDTGLYLNAFVAEIEG